MAGEYTQGVDQVTREAPYIEAAKAAQMTNARSLVNAANANALAGNYLNPDYKVAGTTTDQANAIAAGRAGIGAFQPYMDTAKQGAIAGQINTLNAIQQLKGNSQQLLWR